MSLLQKILASVFGVGFIGRGAGSVAAALYCMVAYFSEIKHCLTIQLALLPVLMLLGVWSSGKAENFWGKDSHHIVIDEFTGMATALALVPVTVVTLSAGFILFRFFDILKPLYLTRLEKLPGGWGVMADDIGAGLYANLILQASLFLGHL